MHVLYVPIPFHHTSSDPHEPMKRDHTSSDPHEPMKRDGTCQFGFPTSYAVHKKFLIKEDATDITIVNRLQSLRNIRPGAGRFDQPWLATEFQARTVPRWSSSLCDNWAF